ncbi:TPA: TcdA/TcdB catalytic glycosyltransferase domain-containing protein [Legionella pneumophila]|uniref:Glycosyltransferase n=1 Tax=Legionella pneumophila TaxID=446 RepID=A0A2S6EXN6_LEGPN|nr:TcdA/TcdB catalytic glycosyltransferase domain-containing protein [Legionella pneumophila]APF03599.1 glycosyltransferase [Legionella pneumophila subsp. fraseri]APF06621.1 glycosyltransferase [Legionella pneumophila subsp. fraseri]AUB69076.1 glycosyltransferase [Legionella pneumophila]AUB72049.1 glycosyltransferase [Legionella pneumophila]KXB23412.1 glycosyltransferase [Legionella pneumophila]
MNDSEYESDSENEDDSENEYELSRLPSKIHFVWVGGPIRAQYLRTIMDVAAVALKSDFEVNLWVDNEMNYIKTSTQEGIDIPNLRIRNVHELEEGMRNDPFYKGDRYKKFWEYVNRERVGFKNLAAAADFFRFEILRQEGGYYFDTDIVFYLDENSQFVADEVAFGIKAHVDLYTGSWRDPRGGPTTYHVNTLGDVNNDIIAAIPEHEVMEDAILNAMQRHEEYDASPLPQESFKKRFGPYGNLMDAKRSPYQLEGAGDFRKHQTIAAGPGALQEALRDYMEGVEVDDYNLLFTLKVGDESSKAANDKDKKPIMGIEVVSKCDKTWLTKKRKAAQKAFDTDSITIEPSLSKESGHAVSKGEAYSEDEEEYSDEVTEETGLHRNLRKEQFIHELKDYIITKKEEARQALKVKENADSHDSEENILSKHFKTRHIEITKGFSVEQKITAVEKLISLLQEKDGAELLNAIDYAALTSSRLGKLVERYDDLILKEYVVPDEYGEKPY